MDLVTGALGMLPAKLLKLLEDEYKLQKGVKVQVQSLSQELKSMHAALCKVAAVPWDQLDEQVKLWAREVREASYDMEDILDTFLVHVQSNEQADPSRLKRTMKKMGDLFSKGKARHEISCAIEDIKKHLQEVAERRARYRVDDLMARPTATSIDPRLSALYTKVSQLVGVEEPRKKVIKMLTGGDGMEMKTVSIVGFGGLGKTTLAKAVYEDLTEGVHFKAFVPVGRNPDLNKVLKDILIGLDKQRYVSMGFNLSILDERQLIDELREFLKDKRYFIVIDDIWDVPSWNIIRYALDDNSLGSKVVITTRNLDVATKVGCSYNMEPLTYESSKVLFYGRIFGSQDRCPKQFVEVSEKIIKKCGGVPLAIITTSSLLANKLGNVKEWEEFCDSIGSGLGINPDMENMRKILSLSYYDLPAALKTCLLYISIFPEDHEIDRDRLIWRWIAEDFVPPTEASHNLFELGKSYFNELLNRSLIQPAEISFDGTPWACRVHDMVLDLICCFSREERFVTTMLGDTKQNRPSFGSQVIHRLSLHNAATWPAMDMSKLRSLTIFNGAIINSMPPLSCHHLLRVLDLEGCSLDLLPSLNLSIVGNLFHLRYMGLRDTRYAGELPAEIEKLQFLKVLSIVGTKIKQLPSSIAGSRQLMCLQVDSSTICQPNDLRNLSSLEELWHVTVNSAHNAESLGHLTQLRMLGVELISLDQEGGCDESICKAFVESLGKLHRIRWLVIRSEDVAANLEGSVESLGNLSYLTIGRTCLMPTWINSRSLPLLTTLGIAVEQVRKEDIQVLGMLPALCSLHLKVLEPGGRDMQTLERRFMVGPDAFPRARVCIFSGFATVPSMFPRGAMPRLEEFDFCIQLEDFAEGELFTVDDLALDHLPSLQLVRVDLRCKEGMPNEEEVMVLTKKKVEEKLRHEADVHPNHPVLDFL